MLMRRIRCRKTYSAVGYDQEDKEDDEKDEETMVKSAA